MNATSKTIIGGAVWLGFCFAAVPDLRADAWAYALLLFAALVVMPLVMDLVVERGEIGLSARCFAFAQAMQFPAALLLVVSYTWRRGEVATLVALPWIAFTGLLAFTGFLRIRRGGWGRPLDKLCSDVALMYTAVGGAWMLADRMGYRPFGFDVAIVTLTAVHFHFAGLLLPLFAGFVQRQMPASRFASRAAVGAVLGVPAVAVGITATQLGWGPSVETAAGCGLALAGMAVGMLQVRVAVDGGQSLGTRALLAIAGASLFIGMVFAAVYALRPTSTQFVWLGVPQMRMLHGTVNAIGFGLCGVLGWRRMARELGEG